MYVCISAAHDIDRAGSVNGVQCKMIEIMALGAQVLRLHGSGRGTRRLTNVTH